MADNTQQDDPTKLEPIDILKAPVEPPSQEKKTSDVPPPSLGQMRSLALGFLLVILGLFVGFLGPVFSWTLLAVGGVFIAVGVLMRI